MKVVILGPVVNEFCSGGVAVFSESLFWGFKRLEDDVTLISMCASSSIDNVHFGRTHNKKVDAIIHCKAIAKQIKMIEPELVISSVQYSIPIKTYKRFWPKAVYVQVLHGVAWPINGRLKAMIVNGVSKYSKKHFDKVVTVSYLSYALNLQYNGLKCDKIINNGCNMKPYFGNNKREIDFCYIGRLFADKQVELLGESFRILKINHPELRIVVGGFGELENLFTNGRFSNIGIEFVGRLSQEQCKDIYRKTRIFVSMHPLETFGTVFNEAILNGANIATCTTTGVAGVYFGCRYFHPLDVATSEDLAEGLYNAFLNFCEIDHEFLDQLAMFFSYERVANEYKSLVDSKDTAVK